MAENVVTRYDPHFHLGMRVMTLNWCFRGWQVCPQGKLEKLPKNISIKSKILVSPQSKILINPQPNLLVIPSSKIHAGPEYGILVSVYIYIYI